MDPLLYVLRIVHIAGAIFWAGGVLFATHFVEPALRDSGPDGARLEQALRRRHSADAMLFAALLTLASGFWLYLRAYGRVHPGMGATAPQIWFGVGGLLALVAFVIELVVTRPSAARVAALDLRLAQAPAGQREAIALDVARLRRRARVGGRAVVALLTLTIVCMAVGRYA
jgi:uncharacterized membrane protein